jgi:hypothetical protein
MKLRSAAASLVILSVLAAGCGRLNDRGTGPGADGGTTPPAISHPTGSEDLVLRMTFEGGFVAPGATLGRVPTFSLYGDGRIVTEGPQIETYPGPAMPNLLVRSVTEEGIQSLLAAARDAGLMDGDATYPFPCIADAATTTFTVTADGNTSVVSAYALTEAGQPQPACRGGDEGARARLADLASKLGDLGSWLPSGALGEEQPYVADEIRVYAQSYGQVADPTLEQRPVDWPLDTSLASFGEPSKDLMDARCGVIGGSDLQTLRPMLSDANQLTPWVSDGQRYALLLRPLLPDEHGC